MVRCTQIKTYCWDNAQVVLVGNKCDMEADRLVTKDKGKRLADQLGNRCRPADWHLLYANRPCLQIELVSQHRRIRHT
jgi:hypothetical protein